MDKRRAEYNTITRKKSVVFGVVWRGLNLMKTYNKTIRTPRLVIKYDEYAESPRKDDGKIGHFFTKESRHKSPDGNAHALYQIMAETADDARNQVHHIELMKARAVADFKESAPKNGNNHDEELHIIEIYPVYRIEHGSAVYKRGTAGGFDYSNCGFYIVTAESISGRTETTESIAKAIDAELAEYTQWVNGEVYRFTLYDENGEEEEAVSGFYELEDIREYLPEDWKDEQLENYLIN